MLERQHQPLDFNIGLSPQYNIGRDMKLKISVEILSYEGSVFADYCIGIHTPVANSNPSLLARSEKNLLEFPKEIQPREVQLFLILYSRHCEPQLLYGVCPNLHFHTLPGTQIYKKLNLPGTQIYTSPNLPETQIYTYPNLPLT